MSLALGAAMSSLCPAGAARSGGEWCPCSCWSWAGTLHSDFPLWHEVWEVLNAVCFIQSCFIQRGDIVLEDMRWNTNAAPSSGKLFILILKVQTSGSREKCFTVNSASVLETCIIFLSMILSLILAGFIMFAHRGTFCAFIFPGDKRSTFASIISFTNRSRLNAAQLLYPLCSFVPLAFCGAFSSLFWLELE